LNKPSPWFSELFAEFSKIFTERESGDLPSRFIVLNVLVNSDLSFRLSGDFAEDYRTIYFNPTTADQKLMKRLLSRKLAEVRVGVDDRQIQLFGEESGNEADYDV
jgi:hypothetical protein